MEGQFVRRRDKHSRRKWTNGRFLVIGFAAGEIPKIPLNLALLKERSIIGVYWGDWTRHDPAGHAQNVELVVRWFAAAGSSRCSASACRWTKTPAALARLTERKVIGKIVVLPEMSL